MKKISIKTVAIIAIALTTVVFTFSPYLFANDSPDPLNPNPDIDAGGNFPLCALDDGYGAIVTTKVCNGSKCEPNKRISTNHTLVNYCK